MSDFEKGTIFDSIIITAPSSSKNKEKKRPASLLCKEKQCVALRLQGACW